MNSTLPTEKAQEAYFVHLILFSNFNFRCSLILDYYLNINGLI